MCAMPQRYVMTLLGFLLAVMVGILKYVVGIVLTEMVVPIQTSTISSDTCPYHGNSTSTNATFKDGLYDWNEQAQGLILGAFWWTYIVLQVPWGVLAERVGTRWVLAVAMVTTNVSLFLTPACVHLMGAWGFSFIRFVSGIGMAAVYPCLVVVLAKWAPPTEKAVLCGIIFGGENLGCVVSMAVSGVILGHWGWPLLFYVYGGLGTTVLVLWVIFGYDSPSTHPFISDKEKKYLIGSLPHSGVRKKRPPTPWVQMFKSLPFWSIVLGVTGFDLVSVAVTTQLPRYMKTVLHFEVEANGLLSAIPYVAMTVVAVVAGRVSDWLLVKNWMSVVTVRKLYVALYTGGSTLGIIGAMYVGCNTALVTVMLTLGIAFLGFYYPSLVVNPSDLSPNYAGTIIALAGYGQFACILANYLSEVLAPEGTMSQWRWVFGTSAGIPLACSLFFLVLGSVEVQPWNDPEPEDKPQKFQERYEVKRWAI